MGRLGGHMDTHELESELRSLREELEDIRLERYFMLEKTRVRGRSLLTQITLLPLPGAGERSLLTQVTRLPFKPHPELSRKKKKTGRATSLKCYLWRLADDLRAYFTANMQQ